MLGDFRRRDEIARVAAEAGIDAVNDLSGRLFFI
jgi:dihydropteroate synthase